jgi:hypothetical protein
VPRDETLATERYLRRLSSDVLLRTPSPAERRSYVGAPIGAVATRMLGTLESMQVWLDEELYYFLLIDNFRPLTKAVVELPQQLRSGRKTARDALAEILLSTSFSLRNPGNDTFVTVLFEQCLGWTVQDPKIKPLLEAGKQMYDGRKVRFGSATGGSQSDLVRLVLAEPGATRHLLDRHHRRLFGAPLPETQQETVARVHDDPAQYFPVLAQWLTAPEYLAGLDRRRPRSDHQFIRSLYMDLLERQPSYDELRNMRNALQSMADSTPVRAVMAKVILDSGKPRLPVCERGKEAEFVTACFDRYLGRGPGQSELAAFVGAMQQDGATPGLVVRALVGSLEYQYD